MLKLKRAAPTYDACDCCGGQRTRLTGVVLEGEVPQGVYYATFTEKHPERRVEAVVSLGDFAPGAPPEARETIAFSIQKGPRGADVEIRDATRCPWSHVPFLGAKLDRDEGMAHPRLPDVYEVATRVVTEEPGVLTYLAREGSGDACASCSHCGKH